MKKNVSEPAFLRPRSVLGVVCCSIGLFLALIAFAVFPGATSLEGKPAPVKPKAKTKAPHVRLTAPPPEPTGPRPRSKARVTRNRHADNPRPMLARTPFTIDQATVSNTYVVNSTADTPNVGPGCADAMGNCTLRAAVEAANADSLVDAITVPAGTYLLTLGALPVNESVLITGAAGGTGTVIDGNGLSRIFYIDNNASLQLTDAVLQNASTPLPTVEGSGANGGAIYIDSGTLTASGVTLTDNTAQDYGGGIYVSESASLWLSNSTVKANTARYGGGVYAEGPSNFYNVLFGGPEAMDGNLATNDGGGLYNCAAVLIENCNFTNNNANDDGGGAYLDGSTIINGGAFTLNGAGERDSLPNGAGEGGGSLGYGAAIYQTSGASTITGTMFSQNGTVANRTPDEGGAIYNSDETMQLFNTTFESNKSESYGGAIYNDELMQVVNATFTNNTAGLGENSYYTVEGAAIYTDYSLSLQDVTFTGTVANTGMNEGIEGGVIYNSEYLTMTNVTISETQNIGYYVEGGVIYNNYYLNMDNVTVTGTTNDTRDAGTTQYTYVEGGAIYNDDYLSIRNTSFDGTVNLTGPLPNGEGNGPFYGYVEGGVLYQYYYASLDNVSITNTTAEATGPSSYIEGTVLYNDDYMAGNRMRMTGSTATADDYVYGAVYNDDWMVLSRATIAQHTATVTSSDPGYGSAAGFWNDDGPVNLTNVTIANNSMMGNGGSYVQVGGIYHDTSDSLTLTNCTVANNSVSVPAGTPSNPNAEISFVGGIYDGYATDAPNGSSGEQVTLKNTIVASNTGGDCAVASGTFIRSAGYNLDSDGTCGFFQEGDLSNTAAQLNALAANGGDPSGLLTLLPQPGSPVIDAGDDLACPATDARGIARPQGAHCDIGAVEFVSGENAALVNIATRLPVGTGAQVLIGGFIIQGSEPKRVIVRAIGPSLEANGVPVPGRMANPTLALFGPGGLIAFNDDWRSTQEAEIMASGMAPPNDLESAIIATLPVSMNGVPYTAVMAGANNSTGVGMVEVYDLDTTEPSKLANISTRGAVGTNDNVMIGGVMVMGTGDQRVVVRALGPSLANAATPVPNPLANPTLRLVDANGDTVAMNDNWQDTQAAEIMATGLAPSNPNESAIVTNLPAGATGVGYTAIVSGVGGATGNALVEVYALLPAVQ